ncbi:MAG TPA: amidohydrolase [Planctomycetota bacterium]|nr:amidohydrolase [Planctomycetota bacterium]
MSRCAVWVLAGLAACTSRPQSVPDLNVFRPSPSKPDDADILKIADRHLPFALDLYRHFHANPELSYKEVKTAARLAKEWRDAGWNVVEGIGGTGVAAVLRNGAGPVLLVRVDMDALPVKEETGLPYAATGDAMHACGHDLHMAAGAGLARVLADLKPKWKGTAILIGQPAEELGTGSKRMIEDPAFDKFIAGAGTPSWCLSIHDSNELPAGAVGVCPGWAYANVDTIDLTIHGKGGHGARPEQTVDPIVIASEIVLSLQTIVSRKIKPGTPAVITVGSIHAGTKHNIISAEAKLQLTVRSYEDTVRERLLAEIRRIAEQIAAAHGAPKPPEMKIDPEYCPAGYHDPALAERMSGVFKRILGEPHVRPMPPVMGGEDFGRFGKRFGVPSLQYWVGAVDPAKMGTEIPPLHSSRWAPAAEPALKTALVTLGAAAVDLLR